MARLIENRTALRDPSDATSMFGSEWLRGEVAPRPLPTTFPVADAHGHRVAPYPIAREAFRPDARLVRPPVRREAAPLLRLGRGFGSEDRREGPGRHLGSSRLGRALPRLSGDSPRYLSPPLAPRLELHRLGGVCEKFTKFL